MKRKAVPLGVNEVKTFADLKKYYMAFASGHYAALWVHGPSGHGKTETAKALFQGRADTLWAEAGQFTALGLYKAVWDYQQERELRLIILNDPNNLNDQQMRSLLNALTEHQEEKRLMWRSHNPALRKEGYPLSYKTSARVCVTSNDLVVWDALRSRFRMICYHPSVEEVHKEAGGWAKKLDPEVYEFVGQNLHLIRPDRIDMRWMYTDTRDDKKAGMTWRELFRERMAMDEVMQAAADVCRDENLSAGERKDEFCRRTGMSDQTYWDLRRKLEEAGLIPHEDGRGKWKRSKSPGLNGSGHINGRILLGYSAAVNPETLPEPEGTAETQVTPPQPPTPESVAEVAAETDAAPDWTM